MKISILTLFPEFFDGFLTNSIIKRALAKDKVQIEIVTTAGSRPRRPAVR